MVFLLSTIPNPTGGGRAMRSFGWVMALQQNFKVHLVIAGPERPLPEALTPFIASVHFLPHAIEKKRVKVLHFLRFLLRLRSQPPIPHASKADVAQIKSVSQALIDLNIEVLLLFRVGMLEIGQALFEHCHPKRYELDLDDIESTTHRSLASIRFRHLHFRQGIKEYIRGYLLYLTEKLWLPRFDQVYVCSARDQLYLSKKYHLSNAGVFKNQVACSKPKVNPQPAPVLLFIGSLDYFPNEDALLFLANRILPAMRKVAQQPFRMLVAGRNALPRLMHRLSQCPEIDFRGELPDLASVYQQASIAIIPLRAGGGTKFKVLEAFLHQIPVIASAEAVSGLELVHGEHYLLAETPSAYAEAFCQLIGNPTLYQQLQQKGWQFLHDSQSCYPA